MNNATIIGIMFTHWLADFVCQSDWMAQNKSKKLDALLAHGGMYTYVMFLCLMWVYGVDAFDYAVVNGAIHTAIDFVTSKINSFFWRTNKVHEFFVSVGFDQFLHAVTLMLTMSLLGAN